MADEQDQGGRRAGHPAVDTGAAVKRVPPGAGAADARLRTVRQPSGDHEVRTALPATKAIEQSTQDEGALDPDIEIMPQPVPIAAAAATKPRADGKSQGPNPDQMWALVTARVKRIDKRRAAAGKPRSGWSDRDYTRTAGTQAEYLKRGRSLLARYKRETGLVMAADEDLDPRVFVRWLFSLKLELTAPSWRAYRLAARACIQALPHAASPEAMSLLDGDVGAGPDELRPPEPGQQGVGHAEPGWARRIDKAHFDAVLASLPLFSRSQMVPPLQDWMVAGIHTGLQSSEWASAFLETWQDPQQPQERRVWLHIVNAKAAHSAYRTIDISNFSDDTFAAVQRMVDRAKTWSSANKFDQRRSQCTQILANIFAATFPQQRQRCSLDTLHHQFVNNAKTKYARAEVAALIGYVGNEAAVDRGKRRLAWPDQEISEIPVPMAAEVTQMRQRLELYEERREASRLREALKERRRRRKAAAALKSGAGVDSEPPG